MHESDLAAGPPHATDLRRGFTLLEVMVVVVIFGIIIAAATPDLGRRNEWNRLEGAARSLSTHLQTARALAVSHRVPYRVVLDPEAHSYAIERQDSDSTWVREPDVEYAAEGIEGMQVEIGGASDAVELVMEPRGTVREEDAPATILFLGARGDSAVVSLVRTGRVTVRMGRASS
jgi:type II secretion system protein H